MNNVDYKLNLCQLWAEGYDKLIEQAYHWARVDRKALYERAEYIHSELMEASAFREDEELVSKHLRSKIDLPLRLLNSWSRKKHKVSLPPGIKSILAWTFNGLTEDDDTQEFYWGSKKPIRPGCVICWVTPTKEILLSKVVDHYYTEDWGVHYLQVEDITSTLIVDSKGVVTGVATNLASSCRTVRARHVYETKFFHWMGEEALETIY